MTKKRGGRKDSRDNRWAERTGRETDKQIQYNKWWQRQCELGSVVKYFTGACLCFCVLLCEYKSVCPLVCVGYEWESLGDREENKAAGRERTSGVCLLTGQVNDSWGLNSETELVQEQGRKLIYPLQTHTCSVVLACLYVCQRLVLIPLDYALHIWKQLSRKC